MRFGVNAIALPGLTVEEAAQTIAELGYTGVEWRVADIPLEAVDEAPSFWGNSLSTLPPTKEAMGRARAAAERHGLDVIGLCPYIKVGDRDYLEHVFGLARLAGAPQVRLYAPWWAEAKSYAEALASAHAFFEHAERVARDHGVKGVIEMHQGTICPSAALAQAVVSRLDPECIGVIYDTGNVVLEGFEDHSLALEILGEHLAHVHLKNAAWRRRGEGWESYWAPLDDGVAGIQALLRLLRTRGYEGWLAMEEFSTDPTVDALRRNAGLVRDWLDEPEPPAGQ
jgi:sugar phosphate isomerase/epimerase